MNCRRHVSLALVVSLLALALPSFAGATEPAGAAETRLRASIDRAVASPPQATLKTASKGARRAQSGGTSTSNGSGGGGGGKMILALLGTAISLGATYYLIKESQKQPEPPPAFR